MPGPTDHDALVKSHFDGLAPDYDGYKKRNAFYYEALKRCVAEAVPPGLAVLEIGTATGEILGHVRPSRGVGIDLSPRMIEIARRKFPGLEFHAASFEDFSPAESFDAILVVDVIEHLASARTLFARLRTLCRPHTRVVLTMANPSWEWLLMIAERLGLKMEEGEHTRVTGKSLIRDAEKEGFRVLSRDASVLLPIHIPFISKWLNDYLARLPLLKSLCLIQRFIFATVDKY